MIEKKNRVPLNNQKNNIIRTNLSTSLTVAQLITALNSGIYADISGNDALAGENVGVSEVGVKLTKALFDEMLAASGTTAGDGRTMTLAQPGFALLDGAVVRFKLNTTMYNGATLNVNGTGAVPVVDANSKPQHAAAGSYCTVVYSSTTGNFILQGNGGGATEKITDFERVIIKMSNPYGTVGII